MNGKRILIFIPTFNESGNVERMAGELAALGLGADIVFLDDNSPDGTGQLLDRLAHEMPRLSVVHRAGKQGIGTAHQAGIARAYQGGYDVLVTMDCDFTHDPKDIPRLLAALDGHDVVVGTRFMAPGSLPGWNFVRRCLTRFGHVLTTRLLGLPHDATGAFRVYDLGSVNPEIFGLISSTSYSFFFESLFVLVRNGYKIKEIPIVLQARVHGSTKLTFKDAVNGGLRLLSMGLKSKIMPRLGKDLAPRRPR